MITRARSSVLCKLLQFPWPAGDGSNGSFKGPGGGSSEVRLASLCSSLEVDNVSHSPPQDRCSIQSIGSVACSPQAETGSAGAGGEGGAYYQHPRVLILNCVPHVSLTLSSAKKPLFFILRESPPPRDPNMSLCTEVDRTKPFRLFRGQNRGYCVGW